MNQWKDPVTAVLEKQGDLLFSLGCKIFDPGISICQADQRSDYQNESEHSNKQQSKRKGCDAFPCG